MPLTPWCLGRAEEALLDQANNVLRLYKAILPDPAGDELRADCTLINVLAKKIRALSPR